MIALKSSDSAPRDGTQIFGDFGYPWLQVAAWCEVSQRWAVATMQAVAEDDGKLDVYFETEYEKASELLGWMPLPEKPRAKKRPAPVTR